MAQFSQWALQYVLSDDEPAQLEISQKAARGKKTPASHVISYRARLLILLYTEIEASRASSTVVGNWAASVQQWMTPGITRDDDQVEDGDEGVSGDIIARAKGMYISMVSLVSSICGHSNADSLLTLSAELPRGHLGGSGP
jgi:DNA repair/transcription protein MET18/MMS19